ncbi:MAG: FAD-binding protein, partial [Candidatus Firestonebacteria bacterium]|nr:FAD-binding protein [Candidatus Firestonebacteria bacterium]
RLNNFLKGYGVFLASYPASTDMATIGGMIANNASGANSCKLGTTQHQVLDLHIVLADGTGLWTSEIKSGEQPWSKITELVRLNKEVISIRLAQDMPMTVSCGIAECLLDRDASPGDLMRRAEAEPVQAALAALMSADPVARRRRQQLEQGCDALIAGERGGGQEAGSRIADDQAVADPALGLGYEAPEQHPQAGRRFLSSADQQLNQCVK